MDRSTWLVIVLLIVVTIGGGFWGDGARDIGGLLYDPGQPQRRGQPPPEPAVGIDAEAFVRQVPAPPSGRLRTQLVIERDGGPRRRGAFIGTAWALSESNSWLSARHVTDGCRRLGFLGGGALPAAIGHPRADISAITLGGRLGDALELSRDPLVRGEDVFLVGFPSGEAASVFGTVTGTGTLEHRALGHRETIVVVSQRKRVPSGSAELGGISGGPVLDADGNVVGTVIGGSARRARSIISIGRNVAWLAASAGGATAGSLGGPSPPMALTPANFARATAPLLADGPIRVVRCDR